ncbi:FAD-dependent oxidoreductase [Aeromicrobium ginsengisoli]|uniref:ferredoxin--NADP(+) reductase n=1 Tax=Aeromicrobium ginsengisoli TaxID=363867 RepID=A0A5M4F9C6_9ACTN|nr:FAD-dependent oxidoreductase [Aeromicrobium ginsengisoli]KAA1394246.1 4Fe-4S dicluster domain-containing protein [Aeromicrobium ginsengisoli]
MTHVITRACCNDAACVPVCPVNCIHPAPDEPDYGTTEMLYIDAGSCIDCGACVDVCPVNAISADYDLPEEFLRYEGIAARYFSGEGRTDYEQEQVAVKRRAWGTETQDAPLRVAIVGSGPAACYAAEEIASQRGLDVQVDMFERLLTPGGLVRFGVAPDHQDTKGASEAFARTMRRKNVRLFLGAEIGATVSHEQLAERYHAIVYAVGAMADRALGIPAESLPGSHSATEFVSWYNGHPDFARRTFDLSGERAVIIGNGNVALDVARILVADPDELARTDMADHAIDRLRESSIREVVVVGRRGPVEAAFTIPELLGLTQVPDLDVVVRPDEVVAEGPPDSIAGLKAEVLRELSVTSPTTNRWVTLRFLASPTEIIGNGWVEGVRLARNRIVEHDGRMVAEPTGDVEELACGLVLRSVGYLGSQLPGLPFDEGRGVVPNVAGRVVDGDHRVDGVYVTGWIKRGPSGVIGSNKRCAQETVAALLDDFRDGRLAAPAVADDIGPLLPHAIDHSGWKRIDAHEKAVGRDQRRPRVKLVQHDAQREIAKTVG